MRQPVSGALDHAQESDESRRYGVDGCGVHGCHGSLLLRCDCCGRTPRRRGGRAGDGLWCGDLTSSREKSDQGYLGRGNRGPAGPPGPQSRRRPPRLTRRCPVTRRPSAPVAHLAPRESSCPLPPPRRSPRCLQSPRSPRCLHSPHRPHARLPPHARPPPRAPHRPRDRSPRRSPRCARAWSASAARSTPDRS
ncbi:hypothetical protein CU044_2927 [Streptomyces sp. L-9-10]|nr:hypothetical protein CU044_2927 [Streptomyces sp. L-9-10]